MENDPNRQARYVKYVTIIRIGSWLYSGNTITGDPVGNALWPSYTAETNNWNKHKKVKNPDWPEAKPVSYLQVRTRSSTRNYREQIQASSLAGDWTRGLALTTRPR